MSKYPDPRKHIILSQQFDNEFLFEVFRLAEDIRSNPLDYSDVLRNKVIALLFYEPSTRTRFSFESAVMRLGGGAIMTENATEFSSVSKGETLADTIRTVSNYVDAIILRHKDDDSSKTALATSSVPIINAGSGKSQHPTQALLDAYTIWRRFGTLEGLSVCFVGDLLRGRTVDSLVYLLSKFARNSFHFVAPENCRLKSGLREHLDEHGVQYTETEKIVECLSKTDVLYMTRIQQERFAEQQEYEKAKGKYVLDAEMVGQMQDSAIIMHPLPRIDEISVDVDDDPRAVYFQQTENGMWVRMALLTLIFGK